MTRPTDLYCVMGNPVEHSRSPWIHARFAELTGQALAYERRLVPLDGFGAALRDFAQAGGRGCNITVPFKFEAFALAARHTPRALRAQACNTLRFDPEAEGGWLADNTDGIGLVRDIEANAGVALAGKRVLLIGAGGAAAGALGPLLEARPAVLVVANRTVAKAEELVARHADLAGGCALAARAPREAGERFDVVINATASSLQGAQVPVDSAVLAPGALALDMMYGPAAQGFIAWAQAHGARGRDGLGMLVEQAAEAFLAWRGVRPDTAPVLAALRAEVNAGAPLARAMAQHPRDFSPVYTAVIAAGEQGGHLGLVLERLADDLEERQTLKAKLIGAALYPAIVSAVALLIVIFLLAYVVPQVANVFAGSKRALPLLTQVMLGVSGVVRNQGWIILIAIVFVAVGARFAWASAQFRIQFDAWLLGTPLVGRLMRGYNAARFSSTLAMLTAAGVPILKALQAAAETLSNRALREDALAALVLVREGAPLASALHCATFLPQVWEQLPQPADLLAELKAKAGLPRDFWSPQVELATYRVHKWHQNRGERP